MASQQIGSPSTSLYPDANKFALAELAQKTKAKENVSDYIPLFQMVHNHAQTSQTPIQFVPASNEHRDLAKRIGERVGNRVAQRLAANHQRLATDRPGTDCPASASGPTGTANPADTPDVAAFASTLEQHVEPLSGAIANFLEERDFIECAGDLAEAVTAVNCSLKHLEQSTENRANLEAAVDRLHATVRTEAQQFQQLRQLDLEQSQQRSETVASTANQTIDERAFPRHPNWTILEGQSPTSIDTIPQPLTPYLSPPDRPDEAKLDSRSRYQQMWQRYSQDIHASTPVKLDYLIGQRAFEVGHSQKEVALMLAAGSPYVAQIHREQGKEKARAYISQTARAVCRKEQVRQLTKNRQRDKQLKL